VTAPTAHGLRPAHAALTRAARRRIAAAFCIVTLMFLVISIISRGTMSDLQVASTGPWATGDVRDPPRCRVARARSGPWPTGA
jgi:hypothetical protein